jgi:hypothetical protein
MVNICPNPRRWHEIYERLRVVCRDRKLPLPPMPLILNGWAYSNDVQKAATWDATVRWAAENDVSDLLLVDSGDWYCVEKPSVYEIGPLGGPMYLPWRLEPSTRPGREATENAIQLLKRNWATVADEIAQYTKPLRFTGRKMRRLLVSVACDAPLPPWGDWTQRANDESRGAFTSFRKSVNQAIAPLEVDHIEFEIN